MAKLNCPCGNQLSNIRSPNDYIGWLLSDISLESEDMWDCTTVSQKSRDVWECDECGRIAIGNHGNNNMKWYKPEDGQPGNLFLE